MLALVTFGVWRAAQTTRTPWAAKITPVDARLAIAPAALYQRMHKSALAFLQDRSRRALANLHVLAQVWDDGLVPRLTTVSRAESAGFELPDSLPALWPGSGGSAAQAGATMQAGWAEQTRVLEPGALPPWHGPAQPEGDHVVA